MDLNICLEFLDQLNKNNNRQWFEANKKLYQQAKTEFDKFIESIIPLTKSIDPDIDVFKASECVFRIFRDVRFSKSKLPYKTNFGALIAEGGRKRNNPGFYLHLEPDNSFIGGGVYMPVPEHLKAIREKIFENPQEFKSIIENKEFKKYFKELYGEKLKSAPRGFPKDFAELELLKYKHYAVLHTVPDSFWTHKDLETNISSIFSSQFQLNRFIKSAIGG